MLPRLYDSFAFATAAGAVDFIGTVTKCTKCLVTETTKGDYTVELETIASDPAAGALISQRIIGVKPNPADPVQFFELTGTERTTAGTIKAAGKHVKNLLCNLASEGDTSSPDRIITFELTPQQIYNKLFADGYITDTTGFTFSSDITTALPFAAGFNEPKTLGAILGGEEGSLLDVFGGEYHYNNYLVEFLASRGKAASYKLRYGQNISSAKQSESSEQTYSHIRPYGTVQYSSNGKNVVLFSPEYAIPNTECRTKKVLPLDCSEAVQKMTVGTQGQGFAEARAAMTAYAAQYASVNALGSIAVSIDVTTRAELDGMLTLGLCDTVAVVLDNFGVTTRAKITSVTYNALLERWEKMTVGCMPVSLADIIIDKRKFNLL